MKHVGWQHDDIRGEGYERELVWEDTRVQAKPYVYADAFEYAPRILLRLAWNAFKQRVNTLWQSLK